MAMFGRYKPVRELYQGRLVTVWTAKKQGDDTDHTYVLNVFRPDAEGFDDDQLETEKAFFLESAKDQQKIAASGSQHWAPIHDYGDAPDGAYYVTDFYARTANRLILGQVKLDGQKLYTIVSSVIEGLLELHRASGRAHGNINPFNVMMVESQRGMVDKAVLTNPWPTSRLDEKTSELDDLRALGELIHQLVLHQPFREIGGWPIPDAQPWSSLGKRGEAWRDFCNRLLDPNLAQKGLSLKQIVDEVLPLLVPPEPPKWKKPAGIAAGVAVVILVVVLLLLPSGGPSVKFDPVKWKEVCYAFDDWSGHMYSRAYPNRMKGWADDDHLRRVLEQLQKIKAIQQIDPGEMVGMKGSRRLMAEPAPEKAKSPEVIKQTEQAWGFIDAIKTTLHSWPPLEAIDEKAEEYESLDWKEPAGYLRQLLNAAQLQPRSDNEKDQPDFIDVYNQILYNYDKLVDLFDLGQTQQAGDELQEAFLGFAAHYLKPVASQKPPEAFEEFSIRLEDLLRLKRYVAQCSQQVIDIKQAINALRAQFANDPSIQGFDQQLTRSHSGIRTALNLRGVSTSIDQTRDMVVTAQNKLDGLMKQVKDFLLTEPPTEDPRSAWRSYQRIGDVPVVSDIQGKINQLKHYQDKGNAKEYDSQLNKVVTEMVSLLQLDWLRRHQREIERRYESVQAQLTDIQQNINDRVAYLSHPVEGDDPRDGALQLAAMVTRDIETLLEYSPDDGKAFQQRIVQVNVQLAQSKKQHSMIRAFEDDIRSTTSQINDELNALKDEVFSRLDPRLYWKPQGVVGMIEKELNQPLGPGDTQRERDALRKQFAQIRQEINELTDGDLAWRWTSRVMIEQRYQKVRRDLDELASHAISDQRKLFEKRWEMLGQQIDEAIAFRKKYGDPAEVQWRDRVRRIEQNQSRLLEQPWPDDPQEKAALKETMRQIDGTLEQLFGELDPRPLWAPKAAQWIENITEGIQELDINEIDTDIAAYQKNLTQITDGIDRLSQIAWGREGQPIMKQLDDYQGQLEQLYQDVFSKLDPRLQIMWDQVAAQISDEIEWLGQTDRTTARDDLAPRLAQARAAIDVMISRPWGQAERAVIGQEVEDLSSRLRAIYTQTIQAQQMIEGVGVDVVNQAWRRRCEELFAQVKRVDDLQSEVQTLRRFLRGRVDALPTSVASKAKPRDWRIDLADQAMINKRNYTLAQAFGPWLDGKSDWSTAADDGRWRKFTEGYNQWRTHVGAMAEDFKVIEQSFDNAHGLDYNPQGYQESIRQIHTRWIKRGVLHDFQDALGSSIATLEGLYQIDQARGPDELLKLANQGMARLEPAIAFAAWRRLPDANWPSGIDELVQEHEIRQWLVAMVRDSVTDPPQKQSLLEELSLQGHERWRYCFERLSQAKDIEEAVRLSEAFGVDVERLAPWAQFNIRFSEFKDRISGLGHNTPVDQLHTETKVFKQWVGALPGGMMDRPEIGRLFVEIDALLSKQQDVPEVSVDLTRAGPESSPVWDTVTWHKDKAGDGRQLTYSWAPPKGGRHELGFIRVEAGGNVAKAFYICTTEVSLGLLQDLMTSADKWVQFKQLVGEDLDRTWHGPKVWRWGRNSTRMRPNTHDEQPIWMPTDVRLKLGGGLEDDYPPQIYPPGPDETYPIQYITPEAAVYLARLLGCRLPSSSEWQAALRIELGDADLPAYIQTAKPNLRDQTWSVQFMHASELILEKNIRIDTPNRGSFWEENRANKLWNFDDQVLWFDPVNPNKIKPGRVLHHLVGNVAEYLFEQPDQLEDLEVVHLTESNVLAEMRSVTNMPQGVAVIGGSAQSSPDVPVDQPMLINPNNTQAQAFSDIGLRLVFSSPRQSPAAQLKVYLDTQSYLTPVVP